MNCLLDNVNCEKIYDSDDLLISDVYFSLKHYASGEEKVDDKEWLYLLKCLTKENEYSIQEKMSITTKFLNAYYQAYVTSQYEDCDL